MNLFDRLCDRCNKRQAVVFFTRLDGTSKKNEAICLVCAKEINMPYISDMLDKLGISDDDIDSLSDELGNIAKSGVLPFDVNDLDPDDINSTIAAALGGDSDDENFPGLNVSTAEFKDILKETGNFLPKAFLAVERLQDNSDKDDKTDKDDKIDKIDNIGKSDKNNANNKNLRNDRNDSGEKIGGRERDRQEKDKKPNPKRKHLEAYCIDLTQRARTGKLDKIIGREKEIERIIQILCRRQKNNPCLIGEPGVGKTAIAEALAVKIATGAAPARLEKKEIHMLDLTGLVAGTQFRGQFESRMKGLIEEVKRLGNIILVIDEVHAIVGAGDAEGSMNAANILKPALSRGDIQVIGATTLGEYRRFIEKDSALERRFQPIIVKEPSIDESIEMLLAVKEYYEEFHGIKISKDTARKAVILSERYITDRFLPDKAIDLIDEASARVVVNSKEIEKLERLTDLLQDIETEIEYIESGNGMPADEEDKAQLYHRLADLKSKKLNLLSEFEELAKARESIELKTDDLANVIEKWTGIPASSISENEFERLNGLENRLKSRLVGQDEAIDAVVRAVKRSRVGISYKRKPVSFIFAGPTGVGKTELVRTLSMDLFDSPESLIRLDMSEFMEKFAVSRIIGAPPGYVGYDEAGQLTEKIRRKPYSVILFDEIEKAHPDVMNILLQILDDGRITDAHGREVNFENTIIVMTTNAGSNLNMGSLGFTESENKAAENKTQKALSDFLRPEFLNRVDEIITFNSLNEENFAEIAKIMLGDLKKALDEKNIRFIYTEDASKIIAKKAFSKKYGARNLRRLIQTDVEDKMANLIIESREKSNIMFSLGANDKGELMILLM